MSGLMLRHKDMLDVILDPGTDRIATLTWLLVAPKTVGFWRTSVVLERKALSALLCLQL